MNGGIYGKLLFPSKPGRIGGKGRLAPGKDGKDGSVGGDIVKGGGGGGGNKSKFPCYLVL